MAFFSREHREPDRSHIEEAGVEAIRRIPADGEFAEVLWAAGA